MIRVQICVIQEQSFVIRVQQVLTQEQLIMTQEQNLLTKVQNTEICKYIVQTLPNTFVMHVRCLKCESEGMSDLKITFDLIREEWSTLRKCPESITLTPRDVEGENECFFFDLLSGAVNLK